MFPRKLCGAAVPAGMLPGRLPALREGRASSHRHVHGLTRGLETQPPHLVGHWCGIGAKSESFVLVLSWPQQIKQLSTIRKYAAFLSPSPTAPSRDTERAGDALR